MWGFLSCEFRMADAELGAVEGVTGHFKKPEKRLLTVQDQERKKSKEQK
jgi:hypothetical protein